jgi:hypothetical protein
MTGALLNNHFLAPSVYSPGFAYSTYTSPAVVSRYTSVNTTIVNNYRSAPPAIQQQAQTSGPTRYTPPPGRPTVPVSTPTSTGSPQQQFRPSSPPVAPTPSAVRPSTPPVYTPPATPSTTQSYTRPTVTPSDPSFNPPAPAVRPIYTPPVASYKPPPAPQHR